MALFLANKLCEEINNRRLIVPTINQMVRKGRKNKKVAVHIEFVQATPRTSGQGRAAEARRLYCCTHDDTKETKLGFA
jgi:hypothetical protein